MDLVVLGANGLLGSNVVARALARDRDVLAAYHSSPPDLDVPGVEFDLVEDHFEALLADEPDAVVNCAAMTGVDACERDPDRAREVNGRAPGRLAARAADRGVRFVQVSTDYVFDGTAADPYPEDAPTDPVQVYGVSKLLGEHRVRAAHPDPLVVRPSFVWGRRGDDGSLQGFPAWVRGQLDGDGTVGLFDDQHVTPTRAGGAAETLLDLLAADATGTYHVACRTCATPYEIGRAVASELGRSTDRLERGSMTDLDRPATRPRYTCLDVSRVQRELGRPQPTLREDLSAGL